MFIRENLLWKYFLHEDQMTKRFNRYRQLCLYKMNINNWSAFPYCFWIHGHITNNTVKSQLYTKLEVLGIELMCLNWLYSDIGVILHILQLRVI